MGKSKSPLTNAQRARMMASIARKARQPTGGRPRLEGDRYDCGKLKPPPPNERVIAMRRHMLGNPSARVGQLAVAENAVDLAHARGWLTPNQREAINAYRELYVTAGPAFAASVLKMKVADMNRSGGGGRAVDTAQRIVQHVDRGHPGARDDLRTIWGMLKPYPARQEALNAIALRSEWPRWMVDAIRRGEEPDGRAKGDLVQALGVVQSVLGMMRTGRTHPFGEAVAA